MVETNYRIIIYIFDIVLKSLHKIDLSEKIKLDIHTTNAEEAYRQL